MLHWRFGLAVLFVVLSAVPAWAQFDEFGWHFFNPSGSGAGQLTPDSMSIVGPDFGFTGGCGGSTNAFKAVAPFELTLVADYTFVNNDKFGCCADFLVTIVDGVETEITDSCYGCQLVVNVPAGSTFGFGVHSSDCKAGEGIAILTNLRIMPTPETLTVDGIEGGERLGTAVVGVGDWDGDSVPDLAVGAPLADVTGMDAGRAAILSGADGRVLLALAGVAAGDQFGQALAVGDVNGDDVPDLIVGAPRSDAASTDAGAVVIHSGWDGSQLLLVLGDAAGDQFGSAVAFAGDVDDDEFGDILVGAPLHDGIGVDSGLARLVSGADGSVLFSWYGPASGEEFGRAVAAIADLNGDGRADFVVGAPRADVTSNESGRVRIFSGLDGAMLQEITESPCEFGTFKHLGQAVASLGDVDADGVADFAIGSPGNSCSGSFTSGAVAVRSGATGALLYSINGLGGAYHLGASIGAAGDVNGDGIPDIVVGIPGDGICCPPPPGRVGVFSGEDGSLLFALENGMPGDWFGWSVTGLGDLDGDGRDDVAVGAPRSHSFGADAGRVSAYMASPIWSDLGHGLPGSLGMPLLKGKGLLVAGHPVRLILGTAVPPGPTALVIGTDLLGAPFKGGVMVPAPNIVIAGLPVLSHGLVLSSIWPTGIPAGFELYFQMWTVDPGAPRGLSASNGLRATTP